MEKMNDLQAGKAGEYLVCADLIMKGFVAFPSEQGLSFDVILSTPKRIYKIQVKTTRQPMPTPQRKIRTMKYIFHVRRCGKNGRRSYIKGEVDIFALVALDTKTIAYIKYDKVKQTMFFLTPNREHNILRHKSVSKELLEYKLEDCL
jgi:hypothetical protein